jgi:uncharacterized protein
VVKLTSKDTSVTFAVRVQPRASKTEIAGELDGALKIKLAAPPVDGAANQELERFLARFFDLAREQVEIISGLRSKQKVVRVNGISADTCERKLSDALK